MKRLLAFLAVTLVVVPVITLAADPATVPIQVRDGEAGYLGVLLGPVPEAIHAQLDGVLPPGQGVMIRDVMAGSPAASAGLRIYDVLLEYGDQKLFSAEQLSRLVRADRPGMTVTLRFLRGGAVQGVQLTLGQTHAAVQDWESVPIPRHEIRPHALPSSRNTANWESFDSISLKKLEDGSYKAEIQYFGEDGKLIRQTFSGTRDAILAQVERQKDLPAAERDQLLDAVSARDLPPDDPFAPPFYMPQWFNWPSGY